MGSRNPKPLSEAAVQATGLQHRRSVQTAAHRSPGRGIQVVLRIMIGIAQRPTSSQWTRHTGMNVAEVAANVGSLYTSMIQLQRVIG